MPCYRIYNTEMFEIAKEHFEKTKNIHAYNVMKSHEGPRKPIGFICGGEGFGDPCFNCGSMPEFLCDFPVDEYKTCDRTMCANCATEIAPNIHYCLGHLKLWVDFKESGGVKKVLENVRPFKKP